MSISNPAITHTRGAKARIATMAIALLSAGAAAYLAGCGGGDDAAEPAGAAAADAAQAIETTLVTIPPSALSAEEASSLGFMREEEKLARDVYAAMASLWETQVFDHIGASEQVHMDAVKLLLSRYGLSDPAAATLPGQFQNEALQALYDRLVAAGRASLLDALAVGAEIEELDIRDLRMVGARTDNFDLQLLNANLERGSRNHLRAFHDQILQRGATYTPKHITQEEYDAIVGSPRETQLITLDQPTGDFR